MLCPRILKILRQINKEIKMKMRGEQILLTEVLTNSTGTLLLPQDSWVTELLIKMWLMRLTTIQCRMKVIWILIAVPVLALLVDVQSPMQLEVAEVRACKVALRVLRVLLQEVDLTSALNYQPSIIPTKRHLFPEETAFRRRIKHVFTLFSPL